MKSLPKGKAKNSSAAQGLVYCNLFFKILAWANTRTAASKSTLGKALSYLKEQWPYLLNHLKGGRLERSNNRAERSMKPFDIDCENFLFANTPSGAKSSAVIFSLIQTAIENELVPYCYRPGSHPLPQK